MNVIDKKICELHPYKNNPRINDKAADMVAKSIEQYGFKVLDIAGRENQKAVLQIKPGAINAKRRHSFLKIDSTK